MEYDNLSAFDHLYSDAGKITVSYTFSESQMNILKDALHVYSSLLTENNSLNSEISSLLYRLI